MITNNTTDQE